MGGVDIGDAWIVGSIGSAPIEGMISSGESVGGVDTRVAWIVGCIGSAPIEGVASGFSDVAWVGRGIGSFSAMDDSDIVALTPSYEAPGS